MDIWSKNVILLQEIINAQNLFYCVGLLICYFLLMLVLLKAFGQKCVVLIFFLFDVSFGFIKILNLITSECGLKWLYSCNVHDYRENFKDSSP